MNDQPTPLSVKVKAPATQTPLPSPAEYGAYKTFVLSGALIAGTAFGLMVHRADAKEPDYGRLVRSYVQTDTGPIRNTPMEDEQRPMSDSRSRPTMQEPMTPFDALAMQAALGSLSDDDENALGFPYNASVELTDFDRENFARMERGEKPVVPPYFAHLVDR